jgi:hypothetical protein
MSMRYALGAKRSRITAQLLSKADCLASPEQPQAW